MVSGSIRYWPKGRDYSNQLVQIYLKIGSEKFIFNGYMKDVDITRLRGFIDAHMMCIKLTCMTRRDNRNMYYNNFKGWLIERKLKCSTKSLMFIAQVKLALLDVEKETSQFKPVVADLDGLTEVQLEMDI